MFAPLNFGAAGGNILSYIVVDARTQPMVTNADIRFERLHLNKLFPNVQITRDSAGTIGGRANLSAKGDSPAQLLGSADGGFGLVMAGGEISNLLLEYAGLDGAEIIKFLLGGDRPVPVRCAVADFAVKNGVMGTRAFVFDTTDTIITAGGNISLSDETLDLTLRPLPKDVSILVLRSPIHIRGTFKHPHVSPDKGAVAARAGSSALLALVNPLAALIPLVETGPGEDADCRALIAMTQRDMRKPAPRK